MQPTTLYHNNSSRVQVLGSVRPSPMLYIFLVHNTMFLLLCSTVEPPNNGHIRTSHFVHIIERLSSLLWRLKYNVAIIYESSLLVH